eukprot:gene11223-12520_t
MSSYQYTLKKVIYPTLLTGITCLTPFLLTHAATATAATEEEGDDDDSPPQCTCGLRRCSCETLSVDMEEEPWYNPDYERIYDTRIKSFLPPKPQRYLLKAIQDRNIIAIGEIHSNPCHHRLELEVVQCLAQARPGRVAIGLECFYRQHQRALDHFIYHHKDFSLLKEETSWDFNWGYDLSQYAKLFRFAALHKIRLVGLNVPIQVAHLVSQQGLEGLPQELRAILPKIDLTVTDHKIRFLKNLRKVHGINDPAVVERYYETQTLWDEYMSESAALYLKANPEDTLVVVAGLGHIQGRLAIPDRIAKRHQTRPFVIVPQAVSWSKDTGLPMISAPLSQRDADWVW